MRRNHPRFKEKVQILSHIFLIDELFGTRLVPGQSKGIVQLHLVYTIKVKHHRHHLMQEVSNMMRVAALTAVLTVPKVKAVAGRHD